MNAVISSAPLQRFDLLHQLRSTCRMHKQRLRQLIQKLRQQFGNNAGLFVRLRQVDFFAVNRRVADFPECVSKGFERRGNRKCIDALEKGSFRRRVWQLLDQSFKARAEKSTARSWRHSNDLLRLAKDFFDVVRHPFNGRNSGGCRPNQAPFNPQMETIAVRAATNHDFFFWEPFHNAVNEGGYLIRRMQVRVASPAELLKNRQQLHQRKNAAVRTFKRGI